MNSTNAIAAAVAAVVAALASRFLADQTWVWSIITGVVVGIVLYAVRMFMARRTAT